ncbi:hypothetical protein DPEC_G00135620 [Dallia pectoralis]|uniref:Uncharacterized protein n=1 Tax=Dallia pectoralis TaxID=75939 RepID=A0ACC2GL67_DALPE|nr:hypothetical protein DPEC_G00135620 [Dallia pectoralis]
MILGLLPVVVWIFTLLFCCHGIQVVQPANQRMNPDGTVSITCELHERTHKVIDARLNRLVNASTKRICQVNTTQPHCTWMVINKDQYKFTLHNLQADDAGSEFRCEFTLSSSTNALIKREANISTILLPAPASLLAVCTPPPSIETQSECSDLLKWLLVGVAVFLCFYSSLITIYYVRLRVRVNHYI